MSTSINGTTGIDVSAVSSSAITADRTSTDGTIVDLQKDGSTVGSIGTVASEVYIGNGDTGLYFASGNNDIRPFNTSTQNSVDNSIDLGRSATRFKDLYLSGGVYLGGTGSANYLDDYEEGTWTPTSLQGTITSYSNAFYTKIGNTVNLHVGGIRFSDITTASAIKVYGHPFATNNRSMGSMMIRYAGTTEGYAVYFSGDYIELFRTTNTASWVQLKHSDLTSSSNDLYLSVTYQTAA